MAELAQFFPGLPDYPALTALRERRQWVAWTWKKKPDGKLTKPPINPHTGSGASHSNPVQWGSYEEALSRAWRDHLPGIGFVLDDRDGLTGADLDKCITNGKIDTWAADILALKETYAEISPSGTGIRMIWRGKVPTTIKCDSAHVEVYRSARYLTITGQHVPGMPLEINEAPKTAAALSERAAQFREPEAVSKPYINGGSHGGHSDFRTINDRALADLGAWVTHVFPRARFQPVTGAYRVSSKDLGRDLEEDLSLAPNGIVDFGVADIGDTRQGKRSPIDIMIEHGGCRDARDAAQWLASRLNISDPFAPDLDAAEGQRALAAKATRGTEPVVLAESAPRPPALDTSSLDYIRFDGPAYTPEALGGLLGAIARHILDTALFPVADFACLSALVFGSALYGRRWSEPIMGGGLNIYAIATAPTGWGKDHPLQEPRNLAYRAEMMHFMGPGEFKSDSAIEKVLRKCPIRACYMDEIGIVLQANAGRNASSWERRVRKALLEVYSASRSMWTGSQAAGDKDEKDKGAEPLHRPILSIYGTSTPEELYKGLTEDNISDGLFGRLIFASPDDKPKRQKPGAGNYDVLAERIGDVRSFTPSEISDKQRGLYHAGIRNALLSPTLIRVAITQEASSALEIIQDWQRDLTEKEVELAKIANRASENVGKLATLRALSRDHQKPELSYQDVQWGWSLIERSLFVIARDIEQHMVGSEFEGLVKAIGRKLKKAGKGGVSLSRLNEAHGISKYHARDRDAVYRQLIESGDIVKERTGNRGFRMIWIGG